MMMGKHTFKGYVTDDKDLTVLKTGPIAILTGRNLRRRRSDDAADDQPTTSHYRDSKDKKRVPSSSRPRDNCG